MNGMLESRIRELKDDRNVSSGGSISEEHLSLILNIVRIVYFNLTRLKKLCHKKGGFQTELTKLTILLFLYIVTGLLLFV